MASSHSTDLKTLATERPSDECTGRAATEAVLVTCACGRCIRRRVWDIFLREEAAGRAIVAEERRTALEPPQPTDTP